MRRRCACSATISDRTVTTRIALTACYILHQRPYRETSLLVDVFAREHGRMTLVARGARRHGNRSASLYQPMCALHIAWTQRGEMGTVTAIEAAAPARLPTGRRLIAAFYLNELLVRLLHRHEAHPELFDAYARALAELAGNGAEERTLRIFEKHLLLSLGYGLVLDHDVDTGAPLDAAGVYHYARDRGPSRGRPPADRDIPVSGAALLALHREQFDDAGHVQECKRLMRALLADQLGDRPLASRDLYRQLFTDRAQA